MLIVDLDDTIFETKSINPKIFDPVVSVIQNYYKDNPSKAEKLLIELWSNPTDIVFEKYNVPNVVIKDFYKKLDAIDYNLTIQPFFDYKFLKRLEYSKVLVTTGSKKLQLSKIDALGIECDFEKIYIDDPQSSSRIYKHGIFKQILLEFNKKPKEVWVIGDNPDSEITEGKKLGINTIQRKTENKIISSDADFVINSFEELYSILK